MLPEQKEVLRKASCLDLSRLKTELLSSSSIPEDFKKHSENLLMLNEYRRFLVLKVIFGDTSPPMSLSPSAIIDQVWHLHLLMPLHYTKCCKLLGEVVVDHDPSSSRDCVELRQKRLDMTKRSYKIAFGEAPPDKFWALQYQLLPGAGRSQLNLSPESVKTTKRSYEKAFKEKQDNLLAKMYRPKHLAITYQPTTGKESNSENDQRKENRNPVSDEAEIINIRVDMGSVGRDLIIFKMRRNTRMKNLYDKIEQMGYDGCGTLMSERYRLVYDGKWVIKTDTIDSLQMEDMEVIEMHSIQSGC